MCSNHKTSASLNEAQMISIVADSFLCNHLVWDSLLDGIGIACLLYDVYYWMRFIVGWHCYCVLAIWRVLLNEIHCWMALVLRACYMTCIYWMRFIVGWHWYCVLAIWTCYYWMRFIVGWHWYCVLAIWRVLLNEIHCWMALLLRACYMTCIAEWDSSLDGIGIVCLLYERVLLNEIHCWMALLLLVLLYDVYYWMRFIVGWHCLLRVLLYGTCIAEWDYIVGWHCYCVLAIWRVLLNEIHCLDGIGIACLLYGRVLLNEIHCWMALLLLVCYMDMYYWMVFLAVTWFTVWYHYSLAKFLYVSMNKVETDRSLLFF